jgi:peptidoglycan/LPS O-acetylase OafA/YrhL
VRRLLPASALVLLITLLSAAVVFAPQELHFTAQGAQASALYLSNMFFAKSAADYFAPRVASNPLLHTWSLAVEEQFYLFWPLLIMAGLLIWRSRRVLTAILIGLTLVSFVACVWLTQHHGVFAFYALPTRAWEFGIGGLAVLLPAGALKLPPNAWLALGWLGSVVVIGCCFVISPATSFPGWIALVPVLATACTLVAGAEQPNLGVGRLFGLAPLQRLGALSYSWYVWHWPFLVFAAALFPGVSTSGKVLAVLLSLAVAHLTYRYFENSIRFNPYLVKRPAVSLLVAAATTVVCLATATLCSRFAVRLAETPRMKAFTTAHDDIAAMPREQCVSLDGSSEVKTCTFGTTESATTLVLFGDSHSIQWFDALRRVTEPRGWKLATVLKSACAAADISPDRGTSLDAQCLHWRKAAIRHIIALRPSLVFLSSSTNKLGRPSDPAKRASAAALADVRDGTRRTLTLLSDAGLPIVFVRDNPEFSFDMPTCLARSLRHAWYPGGSCEAFSAAVLDPAVFEAEQSVIRSLPNARLVDMTGRLCRDGTCRGVQDGLVMYRDSDHLTATFAATLAPTLETEILTALHEDSGAATNLPYRLQ